MTHRDRIVRLITANRDAAERGARCAGCPSRDIPDIAQDAVIVALERLDSRGLWLPDEDARASRAVGAFLYTTARHLALARARTLRRFHLPGVFDDPWYDPTGQFEARSDLRQIVAASRIKALTDADTTLDEYLYGPDVNPSTTGTRLYRLRHGAGSQ